MIKPFETRLRQPVAGQIVSGLIRPKFRKFGFDFAADSSHRRMRVSGRVVLSKFLFDFVQPRRVRFAEIQNVENRLLRKEAEASQFAFHRRSKLEGAQRLVVFEHRLSMCEQFEFAVEFRNS